MHINSRIARGHARAHFEGSTSLKRVLACILALSLLLCGIAVFAEGADTVTLAHRLHCNDLEGGAAEPSGVVIAAAKFMERARTSSRT